MAGILPIQPDGGTVRRVDVILRDPHHKRMLGDRLTKAIRGLAAPGATVVVHTEGEIPTGHAYNVETHLYAMTPEAAKGTHRQIWAVVGTMIRSYERAKARAT